jgi:hypothetical protein
VFNNAKGATVNGTPQNLGPVEPEEFITSYKAAGEAGIGFGPLLIPVAIAVVAICVNQARLAVNVLKGNMTPSEAIKQHLTSVLDFAREYGDNILAGAPNDWFVPDDDDTPPPPPDDHNCDPGYHWDDKLKICVKNKPPDDGGGFKLGTTEILLGAGLLAALALGNDKK